MTNRERVLAALAHREADRVPMDLGSTSVSSLTLPAYRNLRQYMGLAPDVPPIFDRAQGLVIPGEDLLQALSIDTRGAVPPGQTPDLAFKEDEYVDNWGILRRRPEGGSWYDAVSFPLRGLERDEIDHYAWPDPARQADMYDAIATQAIALRERADNAVVLSIGAASVFERGLVLRGYEDFLVDLMVDPGTADLIMDHLLSYSLAQLEMVMPKVSGYVDVVKISDDLGTQTGLLISPEIYRRLVKPRQAELVRAIKRFAPETKVFLHSCGAIRDLIPDFIEIGIDILNPLQVSAAGMDPCQLKRDFGRELVFWGGIDSQGVLVYGTPRDIQDHVARLVDVMAPGGGFVLAVVHNVQPEVEPANIVAAFRGAHA